MAAAQEFYNYADEHFGWAETAKTERERAIFLQMAAAWLEVANTGKLPKALENESAPHQSRHWPADAGARAVARVGSIAATF